MEQFEECVSYFNKTILDALAPIRCWVAGGALRDYFSIGKPGSDIDVFFPNRTGFLVAEEALKSEGGKFTYSDGQISNFSFQGHKVQLIASHYFETPEDTIAAFDFTVACAAVDRKRVYHHPSFFVDLARKRLVIQSLPYPVSTLQRLQKYVKKGFTICNGGLLTLTEALKSVDLKDPNQNVFEFYPNGRPRLRRLD